jgi:membrane protease YdiL (CAAX protease family)
VLLIQVGVGILVTMFLIALKGAAVVGTRSGTNGIAAPLLLSIGVSSAAATALAAALWARPLVRDRGPEGLGLFLPRTSMLIAGLLAGAGVAGLYVVTGLVAGPAPESLKDNFMVQAVAQGGLARLSWALLALLFAPCYEEVLFRGLLWKGFSASWGRWPAGILVTLLFTGLHFSEVKDYWPAALGITTMAVLALAARIQTGSLATATAVHFGYNGVIVVIACLQN